MTTILAVGFSGTPATIWAAGCPTRICGKSDDGARCDATLSKFSVAASRAILAAGDVNARLSCIGHTTAESYDCAGSRRAILAAKRQGRNEEEKHVVVALVIGLVVLVAALSGNIMSNVEQPKYIVVESDWGIEIRDYAATIVAEVDVAGERKQAISEGFRDLADYIFGNNLSSRKVAMTALTQQASEKISITAPVIQQGQGDSWQVRFVMPASYTMATLPKPKNPAVKLREIGTKRFAVIRFSGLAGEGSLTRHTDRLTELVRAKKLTAASAPIYAFYNPPWTLPFLRRNEVMIEVAL
jgi:SOUL heme-binding protein